MDGMELQTAAEVLSVKLSIWTKRLEYAREVRSRARIAECEFAVADLTAKLAIRQAFNRGEQS